MQSPGQTAPPHVSAQPGVPSSGSQVETIKALQNALTTAMAAAAPTALAVPTAPTAVASPFHPQTAPPNLSHALHALNSLGSLLGSLQQALPSATAAPTAETAGPAPSAAPTAAADPSPAAVATAPTAEAAAAAAPAAVHETDEAKALRLFNELGRCSEVTIGNVKLTPWALPAGTTAASGAGVAVEKGAHKPAGSAGAAAAGRSKEKKTTAPAAAAAAPPAKRQKGDEVGGSGKPGKADKPAAPTKADKPDKPDKHPKHPKHPKHGAGKPGKPNKPGDKPVKDKKEAEVLEMEEALEGEQLTERLTTMGAVSAELLLDGATADQKTALGALLANYDKKSHEHQLFVCMNKEERLMYAPCTDTYLSAKGEDADEEVEVNNDGDQIIECLDVLPSKYEGETNRAVILRKSEPMTMEALGTWGCTNYTEDIPLVTVYLWDTKWRIRNEWSDPTHYVMFDENTDIMNAKVFSCKKDDSDSDSGSEEESEDEEDEWSPLKECLHYFTPFFRRVSSAQRPLLHAANGLTASYGGAGKVNSFELLTVREFLAISKGLVVSVDD